MKKEDVFKPENNRHLTGKFYFSPSGKYNLSIDYYKTKPGCWDYTEAHIFNKDLKPIAIVQRNYSDFPFLWVEDHPKGNFLVCGSDYQGQTVVNLDTGEMKDKLSPRAERGCGFCWSEYTFDKKSNILIVEGCVWACPYEYKFFDFSDPMNDWPELDLGAYWADTDQEDIRKPVIRRDGRIYCFQTESIETDELRNYYDGNDNLIRNPKIASIKIFKREGNTLSLEKELVSKKEQKKREERIAANKAFAEKMQKFKDTDPLYLKYAELVKHVLFEPEKYSYTGITYENWCPGFDKKESRWGARVFCVDQDWITIEWAMETGPIKVSSGGVFKAPDQFFMEHTPESMEKAFEYARELIVSKSKKNLVNKILEHLVK